MKDGQIKITGFWRSKLGKMDNFIKKISHGAWYEAPEVLEGAEKS
jgi:hypothetical protein